MSSARARPDRRPSSTAGSGDAAPLVALVEAVIEERELDQREVAEQLGLTPSALRSRLEQPHRLSRDDVHALARALGVPRDRLAAAIAEAARMTPDDDASDEAQDDAARDPDAPLPDAAPLPEPVADATEPPAVVVLDSDDAPVLRALAAVDDGPDAVALRLALLDGLRDLARDAELLVPPDYYDWRRRARQGESFAAPPRAPAPPDVDAADDGGDDVVDADTDAAAPDPAEVDRAVIDAALAAVRRVQETGAGYADLFSPLHDEALGAALASFHVHVHEAALGDGGAFVVTERLHGRHLLVCARDGDAYRRAFARRQALGLVVAGAADDDAAAAHGDWTTPMQRAADLFALADLAPFWQLHDLRRARLGWAAVADAMAAAVRAHTSGWSAERVRDRAALRVALYRRFGV